MERLSFIPAGEKSLAALVLNNEEAYEIAKLTYTDDIHREHALLCETVDQDEYSENDYRVRWCGIPCIYDPGVVTYLDADDYSSDKFYDCL